MNDKNKHIDTKLIHSGEPSPKVLGSVSMPIFQSSTFESAGEVDYHDVRYIRLNNTPNHIALHEKLAAIENAEDALVTGSGMAAISTTLFSLLSQGDHFLAQDCLYGGTHTLMNQDFPKRGISFDFIDGNKPETWENKINKHTRLIYVETMSNPLLQVADLKAIVDCAQKHNLLTVIDNTFASPINFRPTELGFDLSLHSGSKYLNGHTDIVSGAIIGKKDLIETIKHHLDHFGGSLDPHACFLLHRGLKTLSLRVERQNENALNIANYFESHSKIKQVNYPGLESHPNYNRTSSLFDGFGGMMSFVLKGNVEDADRFISRLSLPTEAPSLGGIETLITRPAITSHAGMSKDERESLGISETLVRLSVGIEFYQDLIDDFDQALS
ncbi:MAG: aminotransferase class I/II-fold pyridoxal phosphate-dependent enzyme [Candidatus Marinimicrobia bacterium]|nr:aminotransferase class I/II-fold pyridoxal phosphate-dependent enzyme [Candidatus Neomarinimicrobiota bacterium]